MATTSYTIYSRYDPKRRAQDLTKPVDNNKEFWQFDPTFKPPPPPPPRFVPASVPSPNEDSNDKKPSSLTEPLCPTDISSWYCSLTNSRPDKQTKPPLITQPAKPRKISTPPSAKPPESKDKNNWFIMNAIQSDTVAFPTCRSSLPSLADIIARDPPPLPTEPKFQPPVWLDIGPSNKGFAMMQRRGWREGEPLGPDVIRQPTVIVLDEIDVEQDSQFALPTSSTQNDAASDHQPVPVNTCEQSGSRGQITLLRPIATVLKSDRLGIGLKAKTIGPYKISKKRITHNLAALAAHAKAAKESRRRRQLYGRGQRGFAVRKRRTR